jgi:hypothetical protein
MYVPCVVCNLLFRQKNTRYIKSNVYFVKYSDMFLCIYSPLQGAYSYICWSYEINIIKRILLAILLQYNVYIIYIYVQSNTTNKQWYINVLYITMLNATTCFGLNRPSSGCRTKGETYNREFFWGGEGEISSPPPNSLLYVSPLDLQPDDGLLRPKQVVAFTIIL